MRIHYLIRSVVLAGCLAGLLQAQGASAVEVKAKGPGTARRGDAVKVLLDVRVKDHLHINSHQPADRFYIPLKLTWDSTLAVAGETIYPKPIERSFAFSEGKKLSVLEGAFQIQQELLVKPTATRGFGAATGTLRYQACSDTECYPPASIPVRVTMDIR